MKYPNLREEKKLRRKGYKRVAGLDEAGRGPLAGPVIACALMINPKHEARNSKQIQNSNFLNSKRVSDFVWNKNFVHIRISNLKLRDSKKLTPKRREKIYNLLTKHPAIEWGIGRASEKVIDKINILEATKLAMEKAVVNLEKKLLEVRPPREVEPPHIDFLLLDGNFKINSSLPQKSIVKADEKVFSCACASIIAKVTRDGIMQKYHKKYPQYGFDKHKGYPVKLHRQMLKKHGPCKIHRRTFKPVKNTLK